MHKIKITEKSDANTKRLTSLCWFYILTTIFFAGTTIIFFLGWLDQITLIKK